MFGFGKQKKDEEEIEKNIGDSITVELENMEGDLKNQPISLQNIYIKKPSSEKKIAKKVELPTAQEEKFKEKFSFKKPEEIEKPKTGITSKYLPNSQQKISNESPFLKNTPSIEQNKKIPAISKNNFNNLSNFTSNRPNNNTRFDIKEKNLIAPEEKNPDKKENGVNWLVLILTIFFFLIAIGSGIYYYFFIIKKPNNESPIYNETSPTPEPIIKISPSPSVMETPLPQSLSILPTLQIVDNNLFETLKGLNSQNIIELPEGVIYQIDKDGKILTADELLNDLSINFEDIKGNLGTGWIFVKEKSINNKDFALILEIKDFQQVSLIRDRVIAIENNLIQIFNNLYIDKAVPGEINNIQFNQSIANIGFRYYNFTPGDSSLSLDWGTLILEDDFPVLIFGTSLDCVQDLIGKIKKSE